MLNHVRTLLGNVAAASMSATPAEELVPPGFSPVALSSALLSARRILFGADPDRFIINYRLRQFMTILHVSPLASHVASFDPRITYATGDDGSLAYESLFKPQVTQISGAADDRIAVVGDPAAPDSSGRMKHTYRVTLPSSSTVRVERLLRPFTDDITGFTLTDGLSSRVPMKDAGYSFVLYTSNSGASWLVELINRPQLDLGSMTGMLEMLGEASLLQIFGLETTEPFLTYRNIWRQQRETPLRLSAFLLAMAHRTDARRLAGG